MPIRNRPSKLSLRVESLEERATPTATPVGLEFGVNTITQRAQFQQAVAMDADGDFVVVWAGDNNAPDSDVYGIFARRYSRTGAPQGAQFAINTTTFSSQTAPAIAMDALGNFVVAWQSFNQDGAGWAIIARRYDALGSPIGNEFRVNTTVTNDQTAPAVAMSPTGEFIVTWTTIGLDGSPEIAGQYFDRDAINIGPEFTINSTSTGEQNFSKVAMDANGNFAVVWVSEGQDGLGRSVIGRLYNSAVQPRTSEFLVNSFVAGDQENPAIGMDYKGNFVVAWTGGFGQDGSGAGVYAQRYNSFGARLGTEVPVNTTTAQDQQNPAIAVSSRGDYTITWQSFAQDGNSFGVFRQSYNSDGLAQGGEIQVNTTTASSQRLPSMAGNAEGDYVVAWNSFGQDTDNEGVFAQRFDEAVDIAGPIIPYVFQDNNIARIDDGATLPLPLPRAIVTFSENMWTLGGALGVRSVTNPANWRLSRNGADFSSKIGTITFVQNNSTGRFEATVNFTEQLGVGGYVLTALGTMTDANGNALDGDGNGSPYGENFSLTFSVPNTGPTDIIVTKSPNLPYPQPAAFVLENSPEGTEVGTVVTDDTDIPDRGKYTYDLLDDAGGRFRLIRNRVGNDDVYKILVLDGSKIDFETAASHNITLRATDTLGATATVVVTIPVRNINEAPTIQTPTTHPAVAVSGTLTFSTAGGNPIILGDPDAGTSPVIVTISANNGCTLTLASTTGLTGVSGDGSASVTFTANLADANAAINGLILTPPTGGSVADTTVQISVNDQGANGDPGLVVVPHTTTTSFVVPRLLSSTTGETHVNLHVPGDQTQPSVAMNLRGNYVVVWTGNDNQDGDRFGIFARLFTKAGLPLSAEIQVNSFTALDQVQPKVAMDADGNFVVVWTSRLQDGSGNGIYAQRFDSLGLKFGGEFRVNSVVTGEQFRANVAMDADGDFVVTWTDDSSGVAVINAQRFAWETGDATLGSATRVGPVIQVSGNLTSDFSSVAVDYDGSFAVSWTQADPTTGRWDVYLRTYDAAGNPLTSPTKYNTLPAVSQMANAVAMDYDGNLVLGFSSAFESRILRFDRNGNELASPMSYQPTTAVENLAMNLEGSFGAISTTNTLSNNFLNATFQPFNRNSGVAEMNLLTSNTFLPQLQRGQSIAMDAEGDYVVAWQSNYQEVTGGVPQGYGVYTRVYRVPVDHVGPSVTGVYYDDANDRVLPNRPLPDNLVTSLVAVFSENMKQTGGAAGANSVTNPSNYALWKQNPNGSYSDKSSLITSVTFQLNALTNRYEATINFSSPLVGGHYRLRFNANTLQDVAGNSLLPRVVVTGDVSPTWDRFHVTEFDINRTPTNIILSNNTVAENSPANTIIGFFSSIDADNDGSNTFTLVTNPSNAFRIVGNSLRVLTPSALDFDKNPLLTIRVRVTDSVGAEFERDLNIKLLNRNDAPVNLLPGTQQMFRNGSLVFSAARGNQIRVFDPDGYVNPVLVTLSANVGTIKLASRIGLTLLTGNGTGTVTFRGTQWAVNNAMNGMVYTPNRGRTGTVTLTMKTNDLGSTGLGRWLTDTDTLNITIINRPPLAPLPNFQSAFTYRTALNTTLTVSTAAGVLRGKTDLDGDALTVRLSTSPTRGTVTLNPDGSFTYRPPTGFRGTAIFKFRYFDGLLQGNEVSVNIIVG